MTGSPWLHVFGLIVKRLIAFIVVWIVLALIAFVPTGFDIDWRTAAKFDVQLYLSELATYFTGALSGDFGTVRSGQTVAEAVFRVAPRTLLLLTTGLSWALVACFIIVR